MAFRFPQSLARRCRRSLLATVILAWTTGANAQDEEGTNAPAPANPSVPSTIAPPSSGPTTTVPAPSNPSGNVLTPGGSTDVFAPAPVSGTFPTTTETPTTNASTSPDATNVPTIDQSEAPITVSNAYGASPIVLQPGAGRFAQKPLKFSLSVSQGYDDNIFAANDEDRPTTQVIPGTPEQTETIERIIPGTPAVPPRILPGGIIIPGTPAVAPRKMKIRAVIAPATPDQVVDLPQSQIDKPISSPVTSVTATGSLNIARPRTLFSLQLSLGTLYYWSRPGKKQDYNGSINLVISHRVTPRLRANMVLNTVYQNTPDFSRLNIATRTATGPYYDTNFRLDLDYQWLTRFSTLTSYSFNGTYFEQSEQRGQNVSQNIFAEDFRFTLSPRTTLVTSLRASSDSHENSQSDTTSQFILGGLDFALSRRLNTTLRAGLQIQQYKTDRGSTSSPYVEMTASYVYSKGSTINWTNRYGLEPADVNTREINSYITGLNINHVLSARTSLGIGLNLTHRTSEYFGTAARSLREDYLSSNIGLQYIYTANWSFSLRYEYYKLLSSADFSSYGRNRVTLGVQYDF